MKMSALIMPLSLRDDVQDCRLELPSGPPDPSSMLIMGGGPFLLALNCASKMHN